MAAVLPDTRAPVRARDRDAEPEAAGHHRGAGARLPRAHPRALPRGRDFEPLMTLYLTDDTPPEEIARAKAAGVRGGEATTRRAPPPTATPASPTCARCDATLEAMQRDGLPLLVHGEVTDPGDRRVRPRGGVHRARARARCERFPELKVVFEHITTREAAQFVERRAGERRAPPSPRTTCSQPQRALRRRHPAAPLLPAGAQARGAPPGAGAGGDLGQPEVLPRHRQRAARAQHQGERLRLRRLLHRARRASSSTPRPSRPPARSTGSRPSPASTAPTSTACRATAAR